MESKAQPSGGLHFVGKKEKLIEAKRSSRTLEGRDIVVIHHQGVFYAMDAYCYHAGGLLQNGDIEEIDGKQCIICPNHKYKISLAKGEGLYKGTDPRGNPPMPKWYSKGVKQRVYSVIETNGDVFVKIAYDVDHIDSDYYQGERGKVRREAEKKNSS